MRLASTFYIQGWSLGFCRSIKTWPGGKTKSTWQTLTPCPYLSSCPCPCQLVKVAFMACCCFLYESDRVWERNADQTMWGERKPKGGNLKTTPPSEIFTTTAQGEREKERADRKERTEEESGRRGSETVRGAKGKSKDAAKAGKNQWCLYLLTIRCRSSWIIEQMDWGLLNIHTKALGHQCCCVCVCVCVQHLVHTALHTPLILWCSKYLYMQTCTHTFF